MTGLEATNTGVESQRANERRRPAVQLRSERTGLRWVGTLREALREAEEHGVYG